MNLAMFAGISAEGLEKAFSLAHPSVSACASVSIGSHLEVCDGRHDGSRRGDGRKRNRCVFLPFPLPSSFRLCFPSLFSWFTLERKDSSVSAFVSVSASVASVNQALGAVFVCVQNLYFPF